MIKQQIGQYAEDYACRYLTQHGLKLIARNFSCSSGEIDLVMRDRDGLVFVEVRFRSQASHGDGAESITLPKKIKLIKTAEYYLLKHKLTDKTACRFDVVAMSTSSAQNIVWIKDAFQVEYKNY